MPTASGALTADEKREAERAAMREARLQVTAQVATPEWYEQEADAFEAGLAAHKAGQADGSIKSYERFEVWYPAGEEFIVKVGRRKIDIDEGKARAYGVSDVLRERGVGNHNMMSFGLYAGRGTVRHGVIHNEYGG